MQNFLIYVIILIERVGLGFQPLINEVFMQTLIKNTDAYKLLSLEQKENRLNHAYLILMDDARSLRSVLTEFAFVFFQKKYRKRRGQVREN